MLQDEDEEGQMQRERLAQVLRKNRRKSASVSSRSFRMKEEERAMTCVQKLVRKLRAHWNSLRTPNREEGLDFDTSENKLYKQRLDELVEENENWLVGNVEVLKWVTGLVIAIIVSLLAVLVDVCVRALSEHKLDKMREKLREKDVKHAFGTYLGFNALFVTIATLLVAFLDQKAKGSGVPEIKSYLNGRKIHRVISIRTLFSKLAGVIFSVSGSMVLGKEGPMMHVGAVVGAIISQGRDELSSFGFRLMAFRSDSEKRAFVSIGCACGVAAAFSAPLGGVLFVIEEAASYWSVKLTWLTFFATMTCAAVVDVVISGVNDNAEWGLMSQSSVISFGSFEGASKDNCYPAQVPYRFPQLPIFMLIGAFGGLAGALFNWSNLKLSKWRKTNVVDPRIRVLETLGMSVLTSSLFFVLAYSFPCRPLSKARYVDWNPSSTVDPLANCSSLQPLGNLCAKDHFMNDLESLLLTPMDSTVKQLFHSRLMYNYSALAIAGLTIVSLACVTYGTSIPSGLFVPAILVGSTGGRLVGQLLWEMDSNSLKQTLGEIDPGTFALLGAAAMLGGITRMTISIVVILIETTNNITYAIPIMVTIMSAKVVGDLFTEGLYDMHIELQGIKFIHDEPPRLSHKVQVRNVMVKRPVVFNLFERVSDILEVLEKCSHNGFPVVSNLDVDEVLGSPKPGLAVSIPSLHFTTTDVETKVDSTSVKPSTQDDAGNQYNSAGSGDVLGTSRTGTLTSVRSIDARTEEGLNVFLSADYANLGPLGSDSSPKQRVKRNSRMRSILNKDIDEEQGFGVFEGTILRSELLILLYEKVFVDDNAPLFSRMKKKDATIYWRDFYKHYPRSPSIRDVICNLNPEDFDRVVDLRPYLNSSAMSVHHSVYMTRVHQLFRHLGLRHLTIVNTLNQVVGIVTRDQLHCESYEPVVLANKARRMKSSYTPTGRTTHHHENPVQQQQQTIDTSGIVVPVFEQDLQAPLLDLNTSYAGTLETNLSVGDENYDEETSEDEDESQLTEEEITKSMPKRVVNSWKTLESRRSRGSISESVGESTFPPAGSSSRTEALFERARGDSVLK